MTLNFNPEFRQEIAALFVAKNYSVRADAVAMGSKKSTVNK
jgi:transposase-like protein